MTHRYKVNHRDNPKRFVILEFDEAQSPMRVRDRACKESHYPWSAYTSLKIQKVIDPPRIGGKKE